MNDDLLQQLRGLAEPAPPSWWPPAPGWWLLTLAIVVGLIALARWLRRRHQARAPLRAALKELRALEQALGAQHIAQREYVERVSVVLKRLAHTGAYADQVRTAWGDDWLHMLDSITGSTAFSSGDGQVLGNRRYLPDATTNSDAPTAFDPDRFAYAVVQAARGLARRQPSRSAS